MFLATLFLVITIMFSTTLLADTLDYQLDARLIASNTYVFIGAKEDFTKENGGNIVNTGFIVTDGGVIVIDTGPTVRYGQQMRAAINRITDKPIIKILITHHHPDHFLGNLAFEDLPIYALPGTIELIKRDASSFLDNIYRMTGRWAAGTELYVDAIKPLLELEETIGGHALQFYSVSGHTPSDLMVLDKTTGVFFTGDIVFHNRTPTTPHADIAVWVDTLNDIEGEVSYKIIVPGHGDIAESNLPIKQTGNYISWLDEHIHDSVLSGKDMMEIEMISLPEEFKALALLKYEYLRSVTHLFPRYEYRMFEKN